MKALALVLFACSGLLMLSAFSNFHDGIQPSNFSIFLLVAFLGVAILLLQFKENKNRGIK